MLIVPLRRRFQRRFVHAPLVRLEAARFNLYTRALDVLIGLKEPLFRFGIRGEKTPFKTETDSSVRDSVFSEGKKAAQQSSVREEYTGLPIVFIHYSNSDYLKYVLAQARFHNPDSPIYLIGDESNRGYKSVEHHLISDYFTSSADFAKVYRHFNTSEYRFECFNFQRWFVLDEFLTTHNISECVYLDTDTLLYTDVSKAREKFTEFDFTMSFMTSGSTFFLNRPEALSDLCQFMMDIYAKKKKPYYDRLLGHYAAFRKNGMDGGACDNTAFDFYRYEKFGSIGEAALIIEGSFFDPSIDLPHPGLEMENGLKMVIWKNGIPFGLHAQTGEEIRCDSLQFHGNTKNILKKYYTGPELDD